MPLRCSLRRLGSLQVPVRHGPLRPCCRSFTAAAHPTAPGEGYRAGVYAVSESSLSQMEQVAAFLRDCAVMGNHQEVSKILTEAHRLGEDPGDLVLPLLRDRSVPPLQPPIIGLLMLQCDGPVSSPTSVRVATAVVEKCRADGAGMSARMLADLLTRFSMAQHPDRVEELVGEFVGSGRWPVNVYTALLQHYHHIGDRAQVAAVVKGVHEYLDGDTVWYRSLLRALLELEMYDTMRNVQKHLEAKGVQPDSHVFLYLLQGRVAEGASRADLEDLWDTMVTRLGVLPGARSFYALLSAYWGFDGREGVYEVLRKMKAVKVPMQLMHITLLVELDLTPEAQQAWQLWSQSATTHEAKPAALRRLEKAFAEHNHWEAAAEVRAFRRSSLFPDAMVLCDTLNELLRQGTPEAVEEAMQLWDQADPDLKPASLLPLRTVAIRLHAASGNMRRVEELESAAGPLTPPIANALLEAYLTARELGRFSKVLRRMHAERVRPDARTQQLLSELFTVVHPPTHRWVFEDRALFHWFFCEEQLRMACLHNQADTLARVVATMRTHGISVLDVVQAMLGAELETRVYLWPECSRALVGFCAEEAEAASGPLRGLVPIVDELLTRAVDATESPLDGATAEALLTAFLRLYGAAGEWDRVDAVVQAIQPFTGPPTFQHTATFVTLATAYLHAGRMQDVQALEAAAEEHGIDATGEWFEVLARAYAAHAPDRLPELWTRMAVHRGIPPPEDVTSLIEEHMGQSLYGQVVAQTQTADPALCTALLCACLAANAPFVAGQLWDRMHHEGVVPALVPDHWHRIFAAAMAANHSRLVKELPPLMLRAGVSPDYLLLIPTLNNDLQELGRLYNDVRQSADIPITADMSAQFLRHTMSSPAARANTGLDFATRVVRDMLEGGHTLDLGTLGDLVAMARQGNLPPEYAPLLWGCLPAAPDPLPSALVRGFLELFRAHRHLPLVKEVQQRMPKPPTDADISNLNLLMIIYLEEEDYDAAETIVSTIRDAGLRLNSQAASLHFKYFARIFDADRLQALLRGLSGRSHPPELYVAAIKAFSNLRSRPMARRVTASVAREGTDEASDGIKEVRQMVADRGVQLGVKWYNALLEVIPYFNANEHCAILDEMNNNSEGVHGNAQTSKLVQRCEYFQKRNDNKLKLCIDSLSYCDEDDAASIPT